MAARARSSAPPVLNLVVSEICGASTSMLPMLAGFVGCKSFLNAMSVAMESML